MNVIFSTAHIFYSAGAIDLGPLCFPLKSLSAAPFDARQNTPLPTDIKERQRGGEDEPDVESSPQRALNVGLSHVCHVITLPIISYMKTALETKELSELEHCTGWNF